MQRAGGLVIGFAFVVGCARSPRNRASASASETLRETASALIKSGPIEPIGVACDGTKQALASDFEVLAPAYRAGTSKLCSRGAFLRDRDLRALSTADFIGRARAVFGSAAGDEYALRHKATGIVITIYAGASGPSYGGGPIYVGDLPKADERELLNKRFEAVAKGVPAPAATEEDLEAILAKGSLHDFAEAICLRAEPKGFATVACSLEKLLDATPPADWESTQDTDDGLYRVGVRKGVPFEEKVH